MTEMTISRPDETEYLPYYDRYISLVPEGNILSLLEEQFEETLAFLRRIPEAQAGFRYAPDKWSVRQLLGHVIDGERIFAYRALRFARHDETPLPGFEQDDYVRHASFDDYPLAELIEEWASVRRSTLFLFKHLSGEAWSRRGLASESEVSVRALAYIIAGHERHHRQILRDRYLPTIK